MALSDLEIQTHEVQVHGTTISVRGLNFADLSSLIQEHREDLDALINKASERQEEAENAENPQSDQQLVFELIKEVPELAAKVIAHASGEPDKWEHAYRLGFPSQLDLLMAIGQMTFQEAGGVKKFLSDVLSLMQATRTTLSDLSGQG